MCVSACKSRRRQTASTRCLSWAHAWHIHIFMCLHTLYSRLILYGSNFRFFFFCLVRLVQTFRSRNNHNHNNNNTNAGPIWPEFYYYYIYRRPPRSRSLLHLAKPFVHTRTNRFFFSLFFPSLLSHYIGMGTYAQPYYGGPAVKNASCAFALIVRRAGHIIYIFRGGPPVTDGEYRRTLHIYCTHLVHNM